MTQQERDAIADALRRRGVRLPCPRCGNNDFSVIDGYFSNPLQQNVGDLVLGGQTIPTAVVACSHCGFLSQHALGALGLLPAQNGGTQS